MPVTPRDVYSQGVQAFKARYPGTCGNCGEFDIEPGDEVFYDGETIVRVDCCVNETQSSDGAGFDAFHHGRSPGIRVMPPGKTARDRCDRCFIVHAPGQDGCE